VAIPADRDVGDECGEAAQPPAGPDSGFNARLNLPRWRCITSCLRPDSLIDGFTKLIGTTSNAFQDSGLTTPIIFIMSSGTDPAQDVQNFAAQQDFLEKLKALSLGQGQGEKAAELIESGRMEGFWVLL
jgi:dynein heavy chain